MPSAYSGIEVADLGERTSHDQDKVTDALINSELFFCLLSPALLSFISFFICALTESIAERLSYPFSFGELTVPFFDNARKQQAMIFHSFVRALPI